MSNKPPPTNTTLGILIALFPMIIGGFIVLSALDIIPNDPDSFNAPRWVVAVAGSIFVLAGASIFASNIATQFPENKLAQSAQFFLGLLITLGLAVPFIWVGFGSGERQFSSSLSFGSFSTSGQGDELFGRCIFGGGGLFALVFAIAMTVRFINQMIKADVEMDESKRLPVKEVLQTPKLYLLALSLEQLRTAQSDIAALEKQLQLPIDRTVITEIVERAITMKIAKMERALRPDHGWYTYWLVVIKESATGAGLIGFKGAPDQDGHVEIGYGIAPTFQNNGYITEAVRALIDWAFQDPTCRAVTATTVTNPASERVLTKLGAEFLGREGDASNWIIRRNA